MSWDVHEAPAARHAAVPPSPGVQLRPRALRDALVTHDAGLRQLYMATVPGGEVLAEATTPGGRCPACCSSALPSTAGLRPEDSSPAAGPARPRLPAALGAAAHTCNPSHPAGESGRIVVQALLGVKLRPHLENNYSKKGGAPA
jgi:hypothetical protein